VVAKLGERLSESKQILYLGKIRSQEAHKNTGLYGKMILK
jgi:hypothetical protein